MSQLKKSYIVSTLSYAVYVTGIPTHARTQLQTYFLINFNNIFISTDIS
jgi:hypothetical protein